VLDAIYPPGAESRVPIVAITGTNGKTTTTRLIAHLFRAAGHVVGYTTTDGVYVDDRLIVAGDTTGPFSANVVLSHPAVDVAVLETARGGILRAGLGFDACDVAVVLNVSPDHLGLDGVDTLEQLADVKGLLPAVVRRGGHVVLNADDPLVLAMRARTEARVVLTTLTAPGTHAAVEAHLASGGTVVRVEADGGTPQIVVRDGERCHAVLAVDEAPLTLGGRARFQVANVLAAVAAAHAQRVGHAVIASGLRAFEASVERTPGRMNLVRTPRGDVLLDYAHNVGAVAALMDVVRAFPARRRIALLTAPGDRRDEDLRAIGALGVGLDLLVAKEHPHYRRGRPVGEIAARIAEGARAADLPSERVELFDDEPAAVARALDLMTAGDLVVIVADDFDAVLRQVRAAADA
jgi:cyanophycin synthetase